jgi:hypothetical protein
MMRMLRPALLCVLVCLSATPVAAQVNTLVADNPRETAKVKLGPFHFSPRIELTELGIDTNVKNASDEPESDFTATVKPSATIWLPIARRGLVKAEFAPDLVWYKDFASERSIDPALTVLGEAYLRRFTLFARNDFLHSRQRPTLEIDLRSRRLENRVTAGVDMRLTPKLSLEVHGTRAETAYDADAVFLGTSLEETLNRTSTGFGTVARFRPTVLTAIALKAERFEERFELSPERDADNVRVMPGVEFQPRALIDGSAYIGMRHLNPVDESRLPEFSGLVADLGLSYTLLGATTIGVTYTRDLQYSFEPLQPYYVDNGTGARVRRALGARFDVVLSADRHTYNYRDLILETFAAEPGRVDTIWNIGGSVGYRLGREGRAGLGLTYWRRDSTRGAREYDGLRIGTTASYGF